MTSTERNGERTTAWRDSLNEDELAIALRVAEMPVAMALAWLAVRIHRIEQSTCAARPASARSREVITYGGSAGLGAAAVALMLAIAHALGWA